MSMLAQYRARKKFVYAFRMMTDKIPRIRSVFISSNETSYVFTLPNGTNPAILHDNIFVFKQVFSENIELTGDSKRFKLTVYQKVLPKKVPYKLADWSESMAGMDLPFIVGRNRHNEPVTFDMAVHPHVLLSGETGSGKSSLLRAVLTTQMLTLPPEKVRFVLGDLKRSEFGLLRSIEHVDGVYVEPAALFLALKNVKTEMERRGDLLDKNEATHISELADPLPFIVVAIDEVALLRSDKQSMAIIEDISSVGRSLGVLLILSMQRPDSKLLEGRLKNNLTVRISGRQSDKTNAKVAGVPGAEFIKKSEKGRMVLVMDEPEQVQAPSLDYGEAKRLLQPLKVRIIDKKEVESTETQFAFGQLDEEVSE
ncbi:FtsK/SpoIIIE domain-containing protein [Bacillus massiliglaciei]|uniref:FtsK/SpoIIIE domain-containing protein n=1 Tax=Bacillus massiliglaciei TaxID=1816693 RepID=UPI0018FE5981|nr:FtsK/SpoIIIE domain-containing protein [Bacillus massiliglaciei]